MVAAVDEDTRINAIVVPKRLPLGERRDNVNDDIDTLFPDPERRHFGQCPGLNHPDAAFQWLAKPPAFDMHGRARVYLHGIGAQHIHDDLQISGVSEFEEGCASGHHAGALLQHPEHVPLNRRVNLPQLPGLLCSSHLALQLPQRRSRYCHIVLGRMLRLRGCLQRATGSGERQVGLFVLTP